MADLKKFLDQAGVSTLWSKIAEEVAKVDVKAVANANEIIDLKSKVSALEEGTYDDSAIRSLISDNADAIALLNGDANTAGSVSHTATQITAAKIAEIVAGADTSFDTLKEIADWILNDTTGAASLANDIAALEALVGTTAVATQISEALTAALKVEGVDKYALATDLNALAARVKTLEDAGYQTAAQVTEAITAYVAALKLADTYEIKGSAAQALTDANAYTDTQFGKIVALSTTEIEAAIAAAKANTQA